MGMLNKHTLRQEMKCLVVAMLAKLGDNEAPHTAANTRRQAA
jgi:hypothetical protein